MSLESVLRTIFTTVGAASVGALATIWTGAFGYWNTDRGQDIQMVKIALSILAGENKDTSSQGRLFALDLLEKYSGVKIEKQIKAIWAENGTIPPLFSSLSDDDKCFLEAHRLITAGEIDVGARNEVIRACKASIDDER